MIGPRIQTPKGRTVTDKQYIGLLRGLRDARPCVYGHLDCAVWEGGPCSDELMSEIACSRCGEAYAVKRFGLCYESGGRP